MKDLSQDIQWASGRPTSIFTLGIEEDIGLVGAGLVVAIMILYRDRMEE
jgi:hypothetical protein